jgi:phosphate-selective porin OprO/OprP
MISTWTTPIRIDGAELALAYGPVKVQSEYARMSFDGTSAGGVAYDRDMSAWYAS